MYDFSPYLKGTTLTLDAQFGTDPSSLLTHTVPIKIDELNVAPTDIQVKVGGAVQPSPALNENVAADTVLFSLSAVDINACRMIPGAGWRVFLLMHVRVRTCDLQLRGVNQETIGNMRL